MSFHSQEPMDEYGEQDREMMRLESEALKQLPRDGYCWCDMCGFNAKLPAKYRKEVEDQHVCPDCKTAFLIVADELPEHVAEDEPMGTWPPVYLEKVQRACNRHRDCYSADIEAREQGRIAADHCHDSCCPDCFGQ